MLTFSPSLLHSSPFSLPPGLPRCVTLRRAEGPWTDTCTWRVCLLTATYRWVTLWSINEEESWLLVLLLLSWPAVAALGVSLATSVQREEKRSGSSLGPCGLFSCWLSTLCLFPLLHFLFCSRRDLLSLLWLECKWFTLDSCVHVLSSFSRTVCESHRWFDGQAYLRVETVFWLRVNWRWMPLWNVKCCSVVSAFIPPQCIRCSHYTGNNESLNSILMEGMSPQRETHEVIHSSVVDKVTTCKTGMNISIQTQRNNQNIDHAEEKNSFYLSYFSAEFESWN